MKTLILFFTFVCFGLQSASANEISGTIVGETSSSQDHEALAITIRSLENRKLEFVKPGEAFMIWAKWTTKISNPYTRFEVSYTQDEMRNFRTVIEKRGTMKSVFGSAASFVIIPYRVASKELKVSVTVETIGNTVRYFPIKQD